MKWSRFFGRKSPQPHDLVAAIGPRRLTIIIRSQIGQGMDLSPADDAVILVIAPGYALRLYEPLMTRGTTIKGWNGLRALLEALAPVRILVEDLSAHENQSGLLNWIGRCEAKGVEVVRSSRPA